MKKLILTWVLITLSMNMYPQNNPGKYLGQKEPGCIPELFAPQLVSIGKGVHGNIVFNSDFTEAAWHPNFIVDGKNLIYLAKYINGEWEAPIEFFLSKDHNYSEPFFSYDNKCLLFLSGEIGASGNAENEKIYYVEKIGESWSNPKLLGDKIPAFHWQFSLDTENNLYFGGKSEENKAEIYYSQYSDGKYLTPTCLPATINSASAEFSPFISPDNSYLVFVRMLEQPNRPPKSLLFVSFKDENGNWSPAKNLSEKLIMPDKSPIELNGAPRITPDQKYLFFTHFNGEGHMAYWVSTKVIEDLRD